MLINISNLEVNVPPPEYAHLGLGIRFTVSIFDNDGDPLLSSEGWLYNKKRKIKPPRTQWGKARYSFLSPSMKFEKMLRAALDKFPEVLKVLGPAPEERPYVPPEKIAGDAVVASDDVKYDYEGEPISD